MNAEGVNEGNLVLTQAINVVRTGGGIGVIGVYVPEDAGESLNAVLFMGTRKIDELQVALLQL